MFKFAFGPGKVAQGYTQVLPSTRYTRELGYGFDLGSKVSAVDRGGADALHGGFCTSGQPFFFSVALPEGNYNVTVTLGDAQGPSTTTVKAEARRLMLEKVQTAAGKFETRTFTVNIRTPKIAGDGEVRINKREQGPPLARHWDDKLTLEFNDTHPCLDALEISPADDATTVYLAGDSTVTDQPQDPWNGWGQMLPRFFKPGVAVANHAESGLSLASFLHAKRLDKILSTIKTGDYLFIQFGHNDQKEKGAGVGAFTTYKASLKSFISAARGHGGIPVLVTSMQRRRFDAAGKLVPTLGDFPEAVRQTAREENVPLLDLNAMSTTLFEAMGPEGTIKAFVHYPAGSFPGQDKPLKDDTHFNAYGGYELAKCIVEGIKANVPALAKLLVEDVPAFDPAHPDPVAGFSLPASPLVATSKPEGS